VSQTIHNDAIGTESALTVTECYSYDGVNRLTGFSEKHPQPNVRV